MAVQPQLSGNFQGSPLAIYHLTYSGNSHSALWDWDLAVGQEINFQSLEWCKPVAYHSSYNVFIYNLGSQQITVDYSAFWQND